MVWKKIMEICITKSVHRPKICFVGICTQTSMQIYVHVCKEFNETIFSLETHIFYVK